MLTMLIIQYSTQGPFGLDAADADRVLASEIASEEGLRWKLWLENEGEKQSCGMYLFETERGAAKYAEVHVARLNSWGLTDVDVRYFTVNEPLSRITRGLNL